MAEIVSSPLSGGNGVADDGGSESVISQMKASLDDDPGRQKH
jgi:hypothetical protein